MFRGLAIAFSTALLGTMLLCASAPWQQVDPTDSTVVYKALGYAPIWTQQFREIQGAQIDADQLTLYAIVVLVIAALAGFAAYITLGTPWWRRRRK